MRNRSYVYKTLEVTKRYLRFISENATLTSSRIWTLPFLSIQLEQPTPDSRLGSSFIVVEKKAGLEGIE